MKIINKLNKSLEENRPFWSFEFFPPKTPQGVSNLFDRLDRMHDLAPTFIDVTWGAGGSTSDLTLEICATAQSAHGLETCMHLTCTNMPKSEIDRALATAKANGIQNILALRGDPPRGQATWVKCESGFSYAIDLVRYIRQEYGDYFCIAVAGYPEGHIDNPDKDADLMHLKEKVDAGADYIVTQLFYDVDFFIGWVNKCREIGIKCPILPGIMPIQSYAGFKRMTSLCKTMVPHHIFEDLEPIKDDDEAVKSYGVQLAVHMCNKLRDSGLLGFHFYTLNLEKSVRLILEDLNFVVPIEERRALPWKQSLTQKREKENVRPIFWKNRSRSYVARTESWDEFPNGRWGDSRSPAFGDLDGYGVAIRFTNEEALEMWGQPTKIEDVELLFTNYCNGKVRALPWSDEPLSGESDVIREQLAHINSLGCLSINSQPPVNGVKSNHPVFGWGGKNGYVYQKAYVEFFASPEQTERLIQKINASFPRMTYHVVDLDGNMSANTPDEAPNALTWGVFPGKEIFQPTIVDASSFLAWKDEAFEFWNQWAKIYPTDSDSQKLLMEIRRTWKLVNIVDNDFVEGNIFDLFEGNDLSR